MQTLQASTVGTIARSISDTAKNLGIGRTTLYKLIKEKEIATFKIGDRQLIAESELTRFVQSRTSVVRGCVDHE